MNGIHDYIDQCEWPADTKKYSFTGVVNLPSDFPNMNFQSSLDSE